MGLFFERKRIFIPYLAFFIWFLIVFMAINSFKLTAFVVALTFLFFVFLPGFSLVRIFKIAYADITDGLILAFTLGLICNLSLSFFGILFGLTINSLEFLVIMVLIILFILSLILDFLRPKQKLCQSVWAFKDILQWQSLIYLPLLFLIILVLAPVDQLGTNFTGDPVGHLAIIRRVIENQPITMGNLSDVKNQIQIAYAFPVWHVFLGFITKITNINIFILYREISTILVPLVFLIWYWFFRKLLPTRALAILALFLFIFFHYYTNAYLYTRLPVPDTFNMLLLMPLCFGLALNYIFNKESTYKHLIILSLILAFMGLIHWTQYFYYLFAMGLFAILYAVFKYRESDFRPVFIKILLSIFANMILVLPILLFIQIKARVVSQNMEMFPTITKSSTNDRLFKFDPYFKLSYILLPLIAVFFRQYRRLIFILAVFIAGPLVFNVPGLYPIVRRLLSHVFVNRFYTNLGQWPYIIWAILIGFIFVLVDRLLSKIYPTWKYMRFFIDGLLLIFLVWMFWIQYRTGQIQKLYLSVFNFSTPTFNWLNTNFYWLIPVIMAIALTIYILQKYYSSLVEFFTFKEYENHSTMLILTLIIVFFLGILSFNHLRYYSTKEYQNWHFFRTATDPTPDFINPDKFGGMEAIDFIKTNIPPKSVFDTNTFASYTLPTLVDVHMASYSIDPVEPTKKYKDLYNVSIPIEKKLAMLREGDIDYLIYQYQTPDKSTPFNAYPQYFIEIYNSSTAAIFKVNKSSL